MSHESEPKIEKTSIELTDDELDEVLLALTNEANRCAMSDNAVERPDAEKIRALRDRIAKRSE